MGIVYVNKSCQLFCAYHEVFNFSSNLPLRYMFSLIQVFWLRLKKADKQAYIYIIHTKYTYINKVTSCVRHPAINKGKEK